MNSHTKALIEAARKDSAGPSTQAHKRMREKILSTVAGSAAIATASTAAAKGAVASTAGAAGSLTAVSTSTWVALVAAVAAVAAGGLVAQQLFFSGPVEPAPGVSATVAVAIQAPSGAVAAVRELPSATASDEPAAPAPSHVASSPPSASAPLSPPSGATAASPAKPAASAAPDAGGADRVEADRLAEENALLSSARASLAAGSADKALETLATHETRFPRGLLANERRALMAMALCKKGRVDDGLRVFPLPDPQADTQLSARVRSACGR